jgi:excinuclease ABC subunit A
MSNINLTNPESMDQNLLKELIVLNSAEKLSDNTFTPNPHNYITVKGAKENNLKNVSIVIPKNRLVVFSGLSGSGKSSLVFDTIYAEGQRRYVESLSAYARQFLGLKEKPDVDSIDGLSPAISIDQKSTSQNPRSTVGTITEIYDYLRLLYAKIGHQHCPVCNAKIANETVNSMTERLSQLKEVETIIILSPLVQDQKGWHRQLIVDAKNNGFRRMRINGKISLIEEVEKLQLNRQQKHTIEIVVDRITSLKENKLRILDSLETALKYGNGKAEVIIVNSEGEETLLHFNKNKACPNGHGSPSDLEPRMFSFNSPHGACQTCAGLGLITEIDADLVVSNVSLSIIEGCIRPLSRMSISGGWLTKMFDSLADKHGFSLETPWNQLTDSQKHAVLYGDGSFEGVITNLKRRYKETTSEAARKDIESYMNKKVCPACNGARLKPDVLAVTISQKNISHIVNMPINLCLVWFKEIYDQNNKSLSNKEKEIGYMILKEIISRLNFLSDVGLDYLNLSRSADTLSGGEAQRIRLATQIGSGLTGVLYILDEPSIGLHQRDNTRLLNTLKHLRDLGNTVLVVEHDEETMRTSDYIVDVGPKAGKHGGEIVAFGSPQEIENNPNSPTGRFLKGTETIEIPSERRVHVPSSSVKVNYEELESEKKQDWLREFKQILNGQY